MDKQKLNIEELWKSLNIEELKLDRVMEKDSKLSGMSGTIKEWFSFESDVSVLKGLNRQLWLGLVYSLFITSGYVVLLFGNYLLFVKLVLSVLIFFNVLITYGMFGIMKLVKKIKMENSLLENAHSLLDALTKWKKFQLQFALWVYPWAILGGGVMGYQIGSGLTEIPLKVILILLLLAVPLTWISHRLALWMFNKSFQKSITRIEKWITDIEN